MIRGGRMFEEHFACTYDLFASIPSLIDPSTSVTEELHAFTRRTVGSSKSRLVSKGQRIEAPPLELSLSERSLDGITIEQYFSDAFLRTNFWRMWCTMFAFQPWHSVIEFRRYMRRFMHLMPGFNRLEGIHRTPFNQYDSIVTPLVRWLQQKNVDLQTNASVTGLDFAAADS